MANYRIEERAYVTLFHFRYKNDAIGFKLPVKYSDRWTLNDGVQEEVRSGSFYRVAQIKSP